MLVKNFKVDNSCKLSEIVLSKLPSIKYNGLRKILRNKDIKVNGKRVAEDINLNSGDEISVFYPELQQDVYIVYQDENIVIVFKPRLIETVSDGDCFLKTVSNLFGYECYAVHRLDRNTEGLVVFAKNISAKNELDLAFKHRTLEKYYYALVYGNMAKNDGDLIAYLKKDNSKSLVQISDVKISGYEKIETKYRLIKNYDDSTALISVELVTGKTHQIRAHFAHIGHFVIGDEKYGNAEINKKFHKKYQCLCAYKIVFHFEKESLLYYLNNKIFELDNSKIEFIK